MNEAERDESARPAGTTTPVDEGAFQEDEEELIGEENNEPMHKVDSEEASAHEDVTMSSGEPETPPVTVQAGEEDDGLRLWTDGHGKDLRSHWMDVQAGFVDDPHKAVMQADELLDTTIQSLTESLANRRSALQREWNGGEDLSTEDLRVSMKRYRAFLDRLLAMA
jgi:hypothetical protein